MKGTSTSNPSEPIRPNRAIDTVKDGKDDGTPGKNEKNLEKKNDEHEVDKMIGENEDEGMVAHQRVPYQPSIEERRRHEVTHWPYRSWCKDCVAGKAKASPHFKQNKNKVEEQELPTVCFDYMFLDGKTPILVYKEKKSKMIFAHVVEQKGVGDGRLIERIVKNIDGLGYGRIIVKSDQEPAMKDLTEEVREKRWADMHGLMAAVKVMRDAETTIDLTNGETVVEHSPVASSQSNGFIERAIQDLQGQVRTVKAATERMIGEKIPKGHCLMWWLVEWCCTVLNRCAKGEDGRTAFQRVKGRQSHRHVCKFGEQVMWKPMKTAANRRNKDEPRWEEGSWLGVIFETDEVIIGKENGVVKCRDVRRMPEEDQGNAKELLKVKGWPMIPIPGRGYRPISSTANAGEDGEISENEEMAEEPQADVDENIELAETVENEPDKQMRGMRIRKQEITKYGKTEGCRACRTAKADGSTKPGYYHNEECRRRIQEKMKNDEVDNLRLEEYLLRSSARMAERVSQKADKDRTRNQTSTSSSSTSRPPDMNTNLEAKPDMNNNFKEKREKPELEEQQAPKARRTGRSEDDEEMNDDNEGMKKRRIAAVDCWQSEMEKALADDQHDISEIYSPPRVVAAAQAMGLRGGWSLDITCRDEEGQPWDFSKSWMRTKAMKLLKETKPRLLIGSPMCTDWSVLMNLNWSRMSPEERDRRMREAKMHLEFVVSMYNEQANNGRYWLHEHPKGARSWKEKCMVELLMRPESTRVETHMCRFHMGSRDHQGEGKVLKPTYFATNCGGVAEELDRQCLNREGGEQHRHVPLLNGRAKAAQVYPPELCKAICRGFLRQTRKDQAYVKHIGSLEKVADASILVNKRRELMEVANQISASLEGELERALQAPEDEEKWMDAWDDVKGRELDARMVEEARREEVRYIHKSKLYTKVPRARCYEVTGKAPIKSGWIDTNKGDQGSPNYRSRWVGKEYNNGPGEDLFAATPPIEALRMLVSMLAATGGRMSRKRMLVCDVSRAFFYAPVEKRLFVELPEEDKTEGADEVAELHYSLYGTRDAAANWHKAYSEHLVSIGFKQGVANPCLFHHPGRGIRALVHGDDYVAVADDHQLAWMKEQVAKKFEIKSKLFGPNGDRESEPKISILGRILEWTTDGISYEADPRHALKIIQELGVESGKDVATPGIKMDDKKQSESGGEELQGAEATKFRAIAARCNYLSMDRPDVTFATKEITRRMSKPCADDWAALKRLGRYLKGRPRAVIWYRWRDEAQSVDGYTDSDWAGCRRTRKSTTGGAITINNHLIKCYSKTQQNIALSSGEAELYAIVRASSEVLGIMALYADWGITMEGKIWADASAALGIVNRRGLGKVRHLDTSMLWVQEAAIKRTLTYSKVWGEHNIADLFTKFLDKAKGDFHSEALGLEFLCEQSSIALGLDILSRPLAFSAAAEGGY